MSLIKSILRTVLITLPKKYILRLGFVNYYIHYINGPKDRLILKGNYSAEAFANTIFNTMSGTITLENDIFFSQNVMILTGRHNFESLSIEITRDDVQQDRNIYIGEGSWLAAGCIVLGDVKIGKHCVVMAGAIVTKDIPDYTVVGGIPAKVIRNLKEVK
jgi:acetyltransferase-like isoleucine patch superfamily enzyme